MTEAEAKVVLEQAAWQPLDDKLGEGGGGWVFRCLSMRAYYSVQHVVEAFRGDGFRGAGFKKAFPEFLELIDRAIKGEGGFFGAGKVAKRPDGRMKREIEAVTKVSHPHLVRLIDWDKGPAPSWYVMELFPRVLATRATLGTFRGRFGEVFGGLLQVVGAVEALHEAKYLHRDIKPGNIFVRDTGEWVLGDLGIALADDGEDLTAQSASLEFSRDWAPRWYVARSADQPPTWDLYMLTATALALCLGEKVKNPAWLERDEFEIEKQFPGVRGLQAASRFFKGHFVDREDQVVSRNIGEYRKAVEEVLAAIETKPAPRLLYSWSWIQQESTKDAEKNEIIVYSSNWLSRLRAAIDAALITGDQPFEWYLERWDGEQWRATKSPEALPTVSQIGWNELVADLDVPLEPGWNRLRLRFMGEGLIKGLVIYGE